MSPIVQIFAAVVGLCLIYIAGDGLSKHKLNELQTGMWMLAGIIAIILALMPDIIVYVAGKLGIEWPPSIMLLIALVCLGFIVFHQTHELNDLQSKQIELTEILSITCFELQQCKKELDGLQTTGGSTAVPVAAAALASDQTYSATCAATETAQESAGC